VAGSSAGSNLAAMSALTPNDPAFQPGFESADTSVTAAICLYGYYGHYFGEAPDEEPSPYQPQAYLHPGAPPFLIVHGTKDALATVEAARNFVSRLRRVSNDTVVYAELPGGQHAFDVVHSPRFEAVVDGVEAFAAWVLAAPSALPTRPASGLSR
jgi:acetyl esterase/lipase